MIFQLVAFVCMLITIFWNDVEMKKKKKNCVQVGIHQPTKALKELSPPLSRSHWWVGCCPATPIYQQPAKTQAKNGELGIEPASTGLAPISLTTSPHTLTWGFGYFTTFVLFNLYFFSAKVAACGGSNREPRARDGHGLPLHQTLVCLAR